MPKAFKHHQNACTAQNPAKPAGTGLIANSLSNCLVPGAIAGSKHGFASKDSKVPGKFMSISCEYRNCKCSYYSAWLMDITLIW